MEIMLESLAGKFHFYHAMLISCLDVLRALKLKFFVASLPKNLAKYGVD